MDELESFRRTSHRTLWITIVLENIIFGLSLYVTITYFNIPIYQDFVISGVVALIFITLISFSLGNLLLEPLNTLRQAILHLSPSGTELVKAPDVKSLNVGQELITNLIGQLYEIARVGHESAIKDGTANNLSHNFIANSLPLPLFVLNDNAEIKFVNKAASSYIGIDTNDLIGKNVYSALDMAFTSNDTFDSWLKDVKQKTATATNTWDRVRLSNRDNQPALLFDLAAYYNQGNADGNNIILILFDHTKQYSSDDQSINFMALSVHELRTPITLLRGYIEVFEQELQGKVSPELQGFLDKMQASSEQLTAFVSNILNVARLDSDQLEFKLLSEDWSQVLTKTVQDMQLQATVRDIKLELNIASGLPSVGIDRLSIQEVVNNLIDNAIKYSHGSKVIKIDSKLNGEGLVETTVEDFGVGIPESAMPNIFNKFYRDHHNKSKVGGTGLGLYLSKAIVTAHGGNLWVRSHEARGSVFGFTLLPYEQLSKEQKAQDNKEIVRNAHGWIKNHSYYRR